jgi:crossover junction endodeoxyribonuclease RuvC
LQAKQQEKIRILGIDPGTQVTGVGIIEIDHTGEPCICYYGCIETNRRQSLPLRLSQIFHGLVEIIGKYKPTYIALEDIFYSENIKTAIVMGHARGVSLLAPVVKGIEPAEYSPREVKLSVVGRGNASKGQVQFMVKQILKIKENDLPLDATDALAVALCHYNRLYSRAKLSNI